MDHVDHDVAMMMVMLVDDGVVLLHLLTIL
jgi:hypothetical protein